MAEEKLLKVSSNPHVRSKVTTSGIMLMVIVALMPATGFGIYHFGIRALYIIGTCVGSAVLLYVSVISFPAYLSNFSHLS